MIDFPVILLTMYFIFVIRGRYEATASFDGYLARTVEFEVGTSSVITAAIELEKIEQPVELMFSVSDSETLFGISGARITVEKLWTDDYSEEYTTKSDGLAVVGKVPVGIYRFTVLADGYESCVETYAVSAEKEHCVNVSLMKRKTPIQLHITSFLSKATDNGAMLYCLDGSNSEKSSGDIGEIIQGYHMLELSPGEYTIFIEKDGYLSKKVCFDINENGEVYVDGALYDVKKTVELELVPAVKSGEYMHGYIWRGTAPQINYTFVGWYEDYFLRYYEVETDSFEEVVGAYKKNRLGSDVFFFSIVLDEEEFDRVYPSYKNCMGVVKSFYGTTLYSSAGKNV